MSLSAAEFAVISRLLDEALELAQSERERWLQALPKEHAALVPALREMLAHAGKTSGLLLDRSAPSARAYASRVAISTLRAGDHVGPYELVRELGTGGMAEVWLARRADGAYRREVALKLPMLSRSAQDLERRFALERDIQASMEYPFIARFYDAGISPEGLPYLAMEYVRGEPITTWCDERTLSLRERLTLFLQVVDAVQYAHARNVIHRDLKPSNILVTETGQVRLLDFGIAKLLAEEDEADRGTVRAYARALTPDYASPELLRGEPVEPASDVYSLGAVLYELLSGNRPYELQRGVAIERLAQKLVATPLARPSERLAPGAGPARASTQDRLAGRLTGDLDAVALKALAMSPADRYASAEAFGDDLHRYLSAEPVTALPPRRPTVDLAAALSRNPNVRVRDWKPGDTQERRRRTPQTEGLLSSRTERRLPEGDDPVFVRVTAQVIRRADLASVWSHTLDVDVGDAGASPALAAEIESAIRAAMAAREGRSGAKKR